MKTDCRKHIIASFVAGLMACSAVYAADGGSNNDYSPFSKYGIGSLNKVGTAYSRSMGGVGVAGRDNRYINVLNPAAVTARDSLSFMADFSVGEKSSFYKQDTKKSISNTFNITNFCMSFPIWKSSAFMLGISPFSSVAYTVMDKTADGYMGNTTQLYSGMGSLYQLYFGAGATFWKRLSIGAQFNYYFGNLEKYTSSTPSSSQYRSLYSGIKMPLQGFGGKFGIQYEQPIGKKDKLIVGATYRLSTSLLGVDRQGGNNGYIMELATAVQSDIADTLINNSIAMDGVNIPQEFAVGISYRHADKWNVEVNYTRSDWTKSGMDGKTGFGVDNFSSTIAQSWNAGFEITPNRSDIRYYMKRCSYRVGGYYNVEYYKYKNMPISSYGITLGITMPVFRWLNGVTLGLDLGRRTPMGSDNMKIKENYLGVNVSLNVFDIWFIKPQYQ